MVPQRGFSVLRGIDDDNKNNNSTASSMHSFGRFFHATGSQCADAICHRSNFRKKNGFSPTVLLRRFRSKVAAPSRETGYRGRSGKEKRPAVGSEDRRSARPASNQRDRRRRGDRSIDRSVGRRSVPLREDQGIDRSRFGDATTTTTTSNRRRRPTDTTARSTSAGGSTTYVRERCGKKKKAIEPAFRLRRRRLRRRNDAFGNIFKPGVVTLFCYAVLRSIDDDR